MKDEVGEGRRRRRGVTAPREVERVDPNALGAPEASRGQAAPPLGGHGVAWLVGLLQAGDSFYPTGGYAHSLGLEGLVQEGVVQDRATLREFVLRSALPALQHTELPLAAHAWRAFEAPDWPQVGEICGMAAALKPARELRAAAEGIGRQRAELMAALHHHPLAQDYLARVTAGSWPHSSAVAAALEGRVFGAPLEAVLSGLTYATLAALLAAAMKLLRLGQNACQALFTEALATAPTLIASAAAVPLAEIGWFNPWHDIAAARHENADARMFIS
jgi:urease accessory protein